MKKKYNVTMRQIINMNPCYSLTKYGDKNWRGTLLDILKHPDISAGDKVWIMCRAKFMGKKDSVKFAYFCKERAAANTANVYIPTAYDDIINAIKTAKAADAAALVGIVADAVVIAAAEDTDNVERQRQVDFLIDLIGGTSGRK